MRVGMAELRLCDGYVPQYKEMVKIAKPLIEIMVEDLGHKETIKRFSNPYWFQSLACALGFEHNYTGATTVTIKALKESLNDSSEIFILGGKGKSSLFLPQEVDMLEEKGMINSRLSDYLKSISRQTAKADNSLLQDSYDLYFHSIITDGKKAHVIINQGMNEKDKLVRRYHWYNPKEFYDNNIRSITKNKSLDLQYKEHEEMRKSIIDLIKDEKPEKIVKKALLLQKHYEAYKRGIKSWLLSKEEKELFEKVKTVPYYLYFPKKMNKEALEIAHQSANEFKDLIKINKLGKSTLRGLAYLSSLVYGKEITWENPQRYCFTFGTKAGKPWYVEKYAMREAAEYLKEITSSLPLEKKHKKGILKRLSSIVESKVLA